MDKKKMFAADVVLLIVAAIWGGGFVAGKMALTELSPAAVLFYRFSGAALAVGILFFPRIRAEWRENIRAGLLLGVLQFTGLLVQLVALQYTTPAKQSFLAATYVVFTPLTAWLVSREKFSGKDIRTALLALLGVGLISLNSTLSIQIGDPITLGFALIFSLQIVLTGKFVKGGDALVLAFFQFVTSAVLSLVTVLVTGTPLHITAGNALYGVLYLAFINTALAISLQNRMQCYTRSSHTALILSLESVFGLVFSILFYHDSVTLQMGIGCVLILTALVISKTK